MKERFKVAKSYLFIGFSSKNKKLYAALQKIGYKIVFKPTLKNIKGVIKGNCDAELVLHCMIEYSNFDKAIIVSGDGDFYCLIEYLEKNCKLLRVGIPNKRKYSALLRRFRPRFIYIDDLKDKLERKKGRE